MKRLIPVLDYSTFYVGYAPPKEPLDMLEGYDVEVVILTLVGLRNSLDKNRYKHAKDGAVGAIIENLPPERAQRLKCFINAKPGFSFIESAVIDKILVDIFPKLKEYQVTRELNDGQYGQRIFDVLLCYNERYYGSNIIEKIEMGYELMWSLVMAQGVSRVSKVDFARTGIIKHVLMLGFLRTSLGENFIALSDSLKENTGLPNIYLYISTCKSFFDLMENGTGKGNFVPKLLRADPMVAFLEPMGLVINSNVASDEKFDMGMMLSKPFFETASGDIFVLDHRNFSFLVERAFMFLLFYKSDFKKLAKIKDINGMYSYFGKDFYETFLMGTLLRQLQRRDVRVVQSDDLYLADFTLVVDETDVFVIEVKSGAMHYNVFDAQNLDEFRQHIDKHYLIKAGTPQLERYIGYIRDDRKKLLNIQNPVKKLNIYPIIVCTDPKAATYGVNEYVGKKADLLFSKFKPDFNKVMPLTMIQSDFFVENISLLSKDKTMLKKLIREYHFFIKRKRVRCVKVGTTQSLIEAMTSFDQFAFGKSGAFTLSQQEVHYHLEQVFGLNSSKET